MTDDELTRLIQELGQLDSAVLSAKGLLTNARIRVDELQTQYLEAQTSANWCERNLATAKDKWRDKLRVLENEILERKALREAQMTMEQEPDFNSRAREG